MANEDRSKRPEWWDWELSFTPHIEERMLERGFSEVELRAMFNEAASLASSRRPGRWTIRTRHSGQPWIVVVEPDEEAGRLIVVTAYRREWRL